MQHFLTQNLVHVASLCTLVCYLFRNQIKLRAFAATGDALLSIYYYTAFDQPLWNPMVWTVINVFINSYMIVAILRDGRVTPMSDDELSLFRNLEKLTPGQFRKLISKGTWHKAAETLTLAKDGETLDKLYYVLDGNVMISKAGRSFKVEPKLFIGELAFLRGRPATATVQVEPGAHYMSWQQSDLKALMQSNDDMKNALNLLLSRDMAEKMANS